MPIERAIDTATGLNLISTGGWPCFLLDIFLDDGALHLGTGFRGKLRDLFSGYVYLGLGELGSFTIGAETVAGLASGARYSISGIDPSTNHEIEGFRAALGSDLQTRVQGRRVRFRVGALNEAAQLVGPPAVLRDDTGDSLTLMDSGDVLELVLTAEMRSVDYKRLRRSTNSSVDHQRLHPGVPPDTIFDDDRWRREDIRWGQKKTSGDPTLA